MEPQEVRDVFALVDKVSSLTGRVKDKVAAKGLDEVVESLHALVGPVSANLAAGVLDLSPADVRKLAAGGVLVTPADPRRLRDVLAVARELRDRRDRLDVIRWYLEDRALLAHEGVRQGLAEPGDDVLTPHARQQVDGLDRQARRTFEAWLAKVDQHGAPATDHRVTGVPQRVRVKRLDPLHVAVVELPEAKRAVVLLVEPQVDTYGYVHVLGKAKPGRRTAPFFGRDDRLPGWNSALEELAERAGALADKR